MVYLLDKCQYQVLSEVAAGEGEYWPGDGGVAISKAPRPKSLGVLAGILRPLLIVNPSLFPFPASYLQEAPPVDAELWSKTPSNNAWAYGRAANKLEKEGRSWENLLAAQRSGTSSLAASKPHI